MKRINRPTPGLALPLIRRTVARIRAPIQAIKHSRWDPDQLRLAQPEKLSRDVIARHQGFHTISRSVMASKPQQNWQPMDLVLPNGAPSETKTTSAQQSSASALLKTLMARQTAAADLLPKSSPTPAAPTPAPEPAWKRPEPGARVFRKIEEIHVQPVSPTGEASFEASAEPSEPLRRESAVQSTFEPRLAPTEQPAAQTPPADNDLSAVPPARVFRKAWKEEMPAAQSSEPDSGRSSLAELPALDDQPEPWQLDEAEPESGSPMESPALAEAPEAAPDVSAGSPEAPDAAGDPADFPSGLPALPEAPESSTGSPASPPVTSSHTSDTTGALPAAAAASAAWPSLAQFQNHTAHLADPAAQPARSFEAGAERLATHTNPSPASSRMSAPAPQISRTPDVEGFGEETAAGEDLSQPGQTSSGVQRSPSAAEVTTVETGSRPLPSEGPTASAAVPFARATSEAPEASSSFEQPTASESAGPRRSPEGLANSGQPRLQLTLARPLIIRRRLASQAQTEKGQGVFVQRAVPAQPKAEPRQSPPPQPNAALTKQAISPAQIPSAALTSEPAAALHGEPAFSAPAAAEVARDLPGLTGQNELVSNTARSEPARPILSPSASEPIAGETAKLTAYPASSGSEPIQMKAEAAAPDRPAGFPDAGGFPDQGTSFRADDAADEDRSDEVEPAADAGPISADAGPSAPLQRQAESTPTRADLPKAPSQAAAAGEALEPEPASLPAAGPAAGEIRRAPQSEPAVQPAPSTAPSNPAPLEMAVAAHRGPSRVSPIEQKPGAASPARPMDHGFPVQRRAAEMDAAKPVGPAPAIRPAEGEIPAAQRMEAAAKSAPVEAHLPAAQPGVSVARFTPADLELPAAHTPSSETGMDQAFGPAIPAAPAQTDIDAFPAMVRREMTAQAPEPSQTDFPGRSEPAAFPPIQRTEEPERWPSASEQAESPEPAGRAPFQEGQAQPSLAEPISPVLRRVSNYSRVYRSIASQLSREAPPAPQPSELPMAPAQSGLAGLPSAAPAATSLHRGPLFILRRFQPLAAEASEAVPPETASGFFDQPDTAAAAGEPPAHDPAFRAAQAPPAFGNPGVTGQTVAAMPGWQPSRGSAAVTGIRPLLRRETLVSRVAAPHRTDLSPANAHSATAPLETWPGIQLHTAGPQDPFAPRSPQEASSTLPWQSETQSAEEPGVETSGAARFGEAQTAPAFRTPDGGARPMGPGWALPGTPQGHSRDGEAGVVRRRAAASPAASEAAQAGQAETETNPIWSGREAAPAMHGASVDGSPAFTENGVRVQRSMDYSGEAADEQAGQEADGEGSHFAAAAQPMPPDLKELARQVYPLIKRMIAIERERAFGHRA
jgi:hypothetical protein